VKKVLFTIVAVMLVSSLAFASSVLQPKFVKDFVAGFYTSDKHPDYHTLLGWGEVTFQSKQPVPLSWVAWENSDGLVTFEFSKPIDSTLAKDLSTVMDSLKRPWCVTGNSIETSNLDSFGNSTDVILNKTMAWFKKFPWCKAMETKEVFHKK
jgi:hypothetical protein